MADNKKIIEWEAPEFNYIEKEPYWFLYAGFFAIIFLIYAIIQKNLLFAIFIIIASLLVFTFAKKKPDIILFQITEDGLNVGGLKFYAWRDLEYFSLFKSHEEQDNFSELILKREGRLNPFTKIHFPPDMFDEIREYLIKHIKEEEYEESYTDAIGRRLKF